MRFSQRTGVVLLTLVILAMASVVYAWSGPDSGTTAPISADTADGCPPGPKPTMTGW